MVDNAPEVDQQLALLHDSDLQKLSRIRSLDIPKVSNPRVTWRADVTIDMELTKWFPCVTLIHDFHIPMTLTLVTS
jgi:hypothetical protein